MFKRHTHGSSNNDRSSHNHCGHNDNRAQRVLLTVSGSSDDDSGTDNVNYDGGRVNDTQTTDD